MSDPGPGSPTADEPLGRPFLGVPVGPELPSSSAATEIRPYLLTGGRTEVDNPAIAIETIVMVDGERVRQAHATDIAPAGPSSEKRAILAVCERPVSVAEVAAHLRLPLGVARVLVADLVAEGLLASSAAARVQPAQLMQDVAFVERLIAGVTAL